MAAHQQIGVVLIAGGVLLVLIGAAVWAGGFTWFGRLPGDIRIERGNTQIYFPLATMLVLSIFLSLVLWLVRKIL